MGFFQARTLEWVAIFLLQGIVPIQGLNPALLGLSELQAESLPVEALGKPYVEISLALSPERHFLTYPSNLLSEWMNGSIN